MYFVLRWPDVNVICGIKQSFDFCVWILHLQVEEGCGMATVDDIAAAVHHVLCIIDAEAASQMLLAGEASG